MAACFVLLAQANVALAAGSGTDVDPFTTLEDAYTVASGRYYFNFGSGLFQADVDNSQGGGWILVLQYVHQGGTNPSVNVIGTGADLPITSAAALGADESADLTRWGHAGTLAMNQFTGDIELRWFGQTSGHNRTVHFKSSLGDDYVRTGTGSFSGIEAAFTPFADHDAFTPGTVNGGFSDQGNFALTNFPFFQGSTRHWAIRGNGGRWEVDDFPNNASRDTIHRVWVRGPSPLEVTNTNDSGAGSLRAAVNFANAYAAADEISFNIPGALPHEITLGSVLIIDDADITIDGSTQPGASCGSSADGNGVITDRTIGIEIGGTDDVFRVQAANTTIRGFALGGQTGQSEAIDFNSGGSGSVLCNHIGFRADGLTAWSIAEFGIETSGDGGTATSIDVGDGTLAGRNVFGNTGFANIQCEAFSIQCTVRGNYLNVAADGFTRSVGGGAASILVGGQNSALGGPGAFDGNVIAVANDRAVGLRNDASNLTVEGNFIGVAADGVTPLQASPAATVAGIQRQSGTGSPSVTIRDNVIGGVDDAAIDLSAMTFSSATVVGNSLGVGDDGSTNIATTMDYGIKLGSQSQTDLTIGGTSAADRNVIGNASVDGILMTGTSGVTVLGNYIGLQANGTSAAGNGINGIRLDGASNIDIGDGSSNGGNVISSNGLDGVRLIGGASAIVIDTNIIGLAQDGNTIRGNTSGIAIIGTGVDDLTVNGNVLSGNSSFGLAAVNGATATNITITSNEIGTDVTGLEDRGNGDDGIQFNVGGSGTANNIIIGTPGNGNVISGNVGRAFAISDVGTATIQSNLMGVGADGATALGNDEEGATIDNTTFALFGGTGAGEGNTVSNNAREGLGTGPSATVAILGNTFSNNGELGIDLGRDGFTDNDPGDTDTGDNDLLNFPVLNLIQPSGAGGTDIAYDLNLDVPANTNGYRIEFFRNATPDPSGNGEGQEFIGSFDIVPHPGGDQNFTGSFTPSVPVTIGDSISATATRITASAFDITSEFSANQTVAAGLVVTNTNDSGAGSLRAAIDFANANATEDSITFNIPGAASDVHTITLTSALPAITDASISVDGTTQGDAACGNLWAGTPHTLRIQLDGGGGAFDVLTSSAADTVFKGLAITSAANGVVFDSSSTNGVLQCSYLGLAPDGTAAGHSNFGVQVYGANTLVGGLTAGEGNVVSGNTGGGVQSHAGASAMMVRGNFIGTDPTGLAARPNATLPITNSSGTATWSDITRNLISGNNSDFGDVGGIRLHVEDSITGSSGDVLIQGNYIGVDRTGNTALPNGGDSIFINSSNNGFTIGGTDPADRNVLAFGEVDLRGNNMTVLGNYIGVGADGVTRMNPGTQTLHLRSSSNIIVGDGTAAGRNVIAGGGNGIRLHAMSNTTVSGNYIGVGADGTTDLGGTGNGIASTGGTSATVTGNIIANFDLDGVNLADAGDRIAIYANAIYANGDLGIDLAPGGITANDSPDDDTGANELLNFPVLNNVQPAGTGGADIAYDFNLDVPADTNGYRIEFFKNLTPDGSGNGEGEIYLGFVDITPHAGGDLNFTGTFTPSQAVAIGDNIAATATRITATGFDITSEFSANQTITDPLVVTNTNDSGPGSLRTAIQYANANTDQDDITFDIANVGPHTINVLTALPSLTDDGITIDGSTQTGASCGDLWAGTLPDLRIQINDGATLFLGLQMAGSAQIVRGLSITSFDQVGVRITATSSEARVECNYIGLTPVATASSNIVGVFIEGADAIVGGAAAGQGNVISGNSFGALTNGGASNVTVEGNFIGTNPTGTAAIGNSQAALGNNAGTATINAVRRNLLSGNLNGFDFQADDSWTGVAGGTFSIAGNYIGTNRTGDAAIANTSNGIDFSEGSVSDMILGGTTAADRNIISGNGSNAIVLTGQSDIDILGNYIGLAQDGQTPLANGGSGMRLTGVTNVNIGNGSSDGRNIISSNAEHGIFVTGTIDNVDINGNYIGLTADGLTGRGNGTGSGDDGILFDASTVSDGETIRNNVVSGGTGSGINIFGSVSNLTINSNFVGTDATGNTAVSNEFSGIALQNTGTTFQIGAPGAGNVISTVGDIYAGSAVYLETTVSAATMQDNKIGIGADGSTAIGIGAWGVRNFSDNLTFGGTGVDEGNTIVGAGAGFASFITQDGGNHSISGNVIRDSQGTANVHVSGSSGPVAIFQNTVTGSAALGVEITGGTQTSIYENTITGNTGDGVAVDGASTKVAIYSNTISGNGGIGIDLEVDGVTANDSTDADTGANELLNFPVLNALVLSGTDLFYDLNLDAPADTNGYRIEFFKNATPDGTGNGEGEIYLGFVNITPHSGGDQNISGTLTPLEAVVAGDTISATATRITATGFDITSEFSANQTVSANLVVTNTNDSGSGSLRQAIDFANANTSLDEITFDIPNAGPHRIDLLTALPVISDEGVSIDGTTQTGASCGDIWSGAPHVLQIQINGIGSDNVLRTDAANSTFRGLSLTNGQTGIQFGLVANNSTVQCNYIGLAPDGTVSANSDGLRINANGHLIGGPGATDGNIISGNTSENILLARGDNTTVQGNFIGPFPGGTTAPASQGRGITNNFADDVLIDRNLISGNGNFGYATGPGAATDRITFTNNFIGTDRTGTAALDNGNDGIHINVSNPTDANNIVIGTPGNGNVIAASGDGIEISNGTTITIQDNIIGGDVNGTADLGNRSAGIRLGSNVIAATIGGTGTDERNIIIGNAENGINISAADDIDIFGNYIGVGADGTTRIANDGAGIAANGVSNINIGDGTTNGRNVIGGNGGRGISIDGDVDTISIANNFVGTDETGNAALINGDQAAALEGDAIAINFGAKTNVSVTDNVVGGYGDTGIEFYNVSGSNITVSGNKVGIGNAGSADITSAGGFSEGGIWVASDTGNALDLTISGNVSANAAGPGVYIGRHTDVTITDNEIRDNGGDGVVVINFGQAAVYDNQITDNGGLGIDLGNDGITSNDVDDTDTGANDLLNFPVFGAVYADGTTTVGYTFSLDVPANTDGYRIDFYRNITPDGSGNGEGATHIGTFDIPYDGSTTDFVGSFTADQTVNAGDFLTATATRKTATGFDITSEFSANETATTPLTVTNTNDSGVGSLRAAITFANSNTFDDQIEFDIAGAGPHTIDLLSALPVIADDGVIVDGTTQSGASCGDLWAGTPHDIRIYISSSQDIFDIASADVTIKGLGLTGTGKGVVTQASATNTTVQCNYIGLDAAGASNLSASDGIDIAGSGAQIGGLTPGQGNVISGRNIAVFTRAGSSGTSIQGNFIGTDPTGLSAVPNRLRTINNLSGSATWSDITRNLISGNDAGGLRLDSDAISGSGATLPITGNYIGVDRTGNAALPNTGPGIIVDDLSTITGLVLGGTNFGDGNIIAGNGDTAITLNGQSGFSILGNSIGVGADGSTAIANTGDGIRLDGASDAIIGTDTPNGRNIISGNTTRAMNLTGTLTNITIDGNYIGTDDTGNTAIASGGSLTTDGDAIALRDLAVVSNIDITNNVVGGHQAAYIDLFSISGSDVTIQGNKLGVGDDGLSNISASDVDALISIGGSGTLTNLTIGGTGAGEPNILSNSGRSGINVDKTLSNAVIEGNTITGSDNHGINVISGNVAILSNTIANNGGLGIDLGDDDVPTANDLSDSDGGGNEGLNFPVINRVVPTPDNSSLTYDLNLDVPADTNGYRIEFFKNLTPDGSGHGEGEIYLGFQDIAHTGGDLNRTGTFAPLDQVDIGDTITATATRKTATGHDITSEFAANFTVSDPLVVVNPNDTGVGSLRAAIEYANANNGSDDITFDIPGPGPHTIALLTALPTLTDNGITIDGTTQTNASCGDLWAGAGHSLEIQLDGPAGFNGLNIDAQNITIKGLSITGFANGIIAASGSSTTIQCNYVGFAPDGVQSGQLGGASAVAVGVDGAVSTTIGGPNATDGNVIGSTGGYGIRMSSGATNLRIQNNFVGVDPSGTTDAPFEDAVRFESGSYTVSSLSDNIISGATRDGVAVLVGASLSGAFGDMLVQGNHFGVDRTGNTAIGNGRDGWRNVDGASLSDVRFGGGNSGEGNVFSGNGGQGFLLSSNGTNLTFQGNHFGVGADGTTGLGNGGTGVSLIDVFNLVFGDGSAAGRNIFADNVGNGLNLTSIDGLTVNDNYIGLGSDGATALGNGSRGLVLNSRNTESGIQNAVVTNNVISNNAVGGLDITSRQISTLGTSSEITITRNNFGFAADGSTPAGNGSYGIKNTNVPGEIIVGGFDPADGNTIANTIGGPGIEIRSEIGTQIAILSNSIYDNTGLGIDITTDVVDGVTPNDPNDVDNGPNELLNFPVLVGIAADGSFSLSYEFTLDVPDNPQGYDVNFFKTSTPDATHGEGEEFLGSVFINHAGGNLEFSGQLASLESVSVGDSISATVTRRTSTSYDITSEFSENIVAGAASVNITNAYNFASLLDFTTLEQTITVENTGSQSLTNPDVTSLPTQGFNNLPLTTGPIYDSGDTDGDGNIDIGETWVYTGTLSITDVILNEQTSIISIARLDSDQLFNQTSNTVTLPINLSFPLSAPNRCVGTNLVANGGFETPVRAIPPRGSAVVADVSVDDWFSNDGQMELVTSGFAQNSIIYFSHSGAQHAEINALGNTNITATSAINGRAEVAVFWAHRGENGDDTAALRITDNDGGQTDAPDFTTGNADWAEYEEFHVVGENASSATVRFSSVSSIGGNSDGNLLDSVEVCQTYLTLASAQGTKTDVDGSGTDSAGDTLVYEFTVANPAGNHASLTTVEIVDDKLGTFTATPASGDDGDGVLEPGETWVVNRTYTFEQADVDAESYSSTHYVQGDTGNNIIRSGDDTQSVTLSVNPEVQLVKTGAFKVDQDGDGRADAGDVITYTYTVTNVGDVTLINISVSDVHNGNGDTPSLVHDQLTDNGTANDSTDADGDPGNWEQLGPDDVITFTWDYTVVQDDVELLQP